MDESETGLVPASETLPYVASDAPDLTARIYRALKARTPADEENARDEALEQLDPGLVDEARRLGFELLGVSRERGAFGFQCPTLHFVDDTGTVELELTRGRNALYGSTQYRMRAHLRDGTTLAIEPQKLFQRSSDVEFVFPEADSLRTSYQFLQRAAAYHSERWHSPLVCVDELDESLELIDHYEMTRAPRESLSTQIRQMAALPLILAGGVGLPVLLILLALML